MRVQYTTCLVEGLLDQVQAFKGFNSDQQLAEYLDVSRRTLVRLRAGSKPDVELICRLLDITGRPFNKVVAVSRKKVA